MTKYTLSQRSSKSRGSRKSDESYNSMRSLNERIMSGVDPRDPIYHLAQCLFYTIHQKNTIGLPMTLGGGAPKILVLRMYESEKELQADAMGYLNECYNSFKGITKDYFSFGNYIELVLNRFLDTKLIRKMKQENYSQLFTSVFNKACVAYIRDLSANQPSLYVHDTPEIYSAPCTELIKKRLITAFEVTVHTMIDDNPESVPRALYEQVKLDRDRLAKKYKKLKRKYKKLKKEFD